MDNFSKDGGEDGAACRELNRPWFVFQANVTATLDITFDGGWSIYRLYSEGEIDGSEDIFVRFVMNPRFA